MQARWSVTQCGSLQNVWDSYARQGGRIGAGGFGFVYKAQSRKSKEMVAVKAVPKLDLKRAPPSTAPEQLVQMRRRDAQRLREEIKIMRLLDHPNIVMLHETFEDAESVFLVMELCSGGELLGFILESGHHSEMQAAIVMRQVFKAVRYMHSQQVCHRDLKHSNTLLLSHAPCHENVVKVVDFGLACSFTPGEVLRQCAGTVVYVAPQVLECRYDHRVDLWSCGVLLYILLCGYPPFRGETDAAIMTAIRRGNYSFPARDWSIVSENAKALIRSLLKMKVKDRISIDDALEHSWTQEPPDGAQLSKTLERIRKFMAHQNQTQDVNPQQNEAPPMAETEVGDDAGGPMKCASQSSIATRIPSSPGAWFQEQFAAITAAVGSVMSSKSKKGFVASEEIASSGPELPGDKEKPGVREAVPQGDKDMSPSQVFLMKHLEEDERQAQQAKMILEELSPASLVFRQKHVEHEDSPQSKQLIEEVSPRVSPRAATPKVSVSPRVSPRPEAFQMPKEDSPRVEAPRPEAFRVPKASEAIFSGPRAEAPFCPPVWLDPLPGESLMDLSSTEKPVVDASDDLPPPPEPPEDPPESDPESPDSPECSRAFVGQPLEFFSKTAQRWLPCEVINVRSDLAIMVTVKPNTWLSLEDQRIRIREPQVKDRGVEQDHQQDLGQLMVGQAVEYFSASAGRWIPCEVTMVDAEQSVQLDVKPGAWIPRRHQLSRLRRAAQPVVPGADGRASAKASSSGYRQDTKALEYYSLNLTAWIPCVILEEDASGNVVIDALPYAWITPAQQASYLRPAAAPGLQLRIPLIGDKVVYFSASHKRWIPTIVTDVGDRDEVELEIKPGVWLQREAQQRVLRWCASKL